MQDSVLPRGVGLRKPHISPYLSPNLLPLSTCSPFPCGPWTPSTLAVLRVAPFGVFGVFCGFFLSIQCFFCVFCVFCGFLSTCSPFPCGPWTPSTLAVLRGALFWCIWGILWFLPLHAVLFLCVLCVLWFPLHMQSPSAVFLRYACKKTAP